MIKIITPDLKTVKVQGKAIILAKKTDNTIIFDIVSNTTIDATQYLFGIIFTEEDEIWQQ